jgi:CHAT domain-containing protein
LQIQHGLEQSACAGIMGDIGIAAKAALRAAEEAQKSNYGALYLRALDFGAATRFETGDRPGAWKLLRAGLERYWSAQLPAMQGYNLYQVGGSWGGNEQPNLSMAIWREAAALIDSAEDPLVRAAVHNYLANAATAAHQPQLAEQHYAQAARLYALAPRTEASHSDTIENEIRAVQIESRLGQFDTAIARLTSVQDDVRPLSNNYLVQIFYSTLGEVQLRSHHAAEAEQALRPALRLAERNLASLTSESERISWSKDAAPVYLGLAEADMVQGREQESLDVFEWYLGAPQRVGMSARATSQHSAELLRSLPDPSRMLSRLPLLSNQTVLAYGVLPDGLAIWAYDNRGVSATWIPKSPQELQNLASNFYAECSDPSSELSALRRDSQSLYSLLIGPIEQRLDPKRTLVIETEGFLARLPFEALMDSSGQYLIARGPIVHSPGPYAEARMHPDIAISPDLPTLVVGSAASSPDAGLFVVPNVPDGADAVASGFHSPRVLKGPEATLGAVRSALPAAAVFHFAGHAITTSNHTGLMLEGRDTDVRTDDKRKDDAGKDDARTGAPVLLLDANVVRKLNLRNMQLAVLAACSTDSGEGGSRGFDNVAEALQTSGVPHVVASRWAVDSVEANAFVDDFYRSLLSGQPVSKATRLTSQKMLLNPHTAHPYYWAAFAAYGRP